MKKSLLNKIEQINQLLPTVNDLDEIPLTYDGGTYPIWVQLSAPITVKNQFVYIHYQQSRLQLNYGDGKTRYNINKTDMFDDNGLFHLEYDLKIILKAFKTAIKRDGYRY